MPGTKISCNSFYMYMLAVKKREESKGKRFSRGLDDVVPLASFEWYHLSPDVKAVYKKKAREYKNSVEFRTKKRMIRNKPRRMKGKPKRDGTSSEESFNDDDEFIFYDPDDEDKFYRRRERDRNNLKTALTWNMGGEYLAKKVTVESFFVVSIQNYYETAAHEYMPAEISMIEFSLTRGVMSQYTVMLKPMFIPDHCRMLSSKKATETHQILPECPPSESRDDYRNVIDEIKSFFAHKQSNQFRVFVLTKQFNSVQGGVKVLRDRTCSKYFIPAEKITNVEDLFVLLCAFKGVSPKRTDLMGFDELLLETNWDYEPHTLCNFHNRQQSKYCTLAVARKICYYLFERLKDVYGLNLTSNHIPPLPMKSKFRHPNANGYDTPEWTMNQQSQMGNQKMRPVPLMNLDDIDPYYSNPNRNWNDWNQSSNYHAQYQSYDRMYCSPASPVMPVGNYENFAPFCEGSPSKYLNTDKREMYNSDNQQHSINACTSKYLAEFILPTKSQIGQTSRYCSVGTQCNNDDYWCRQANSPTKQRSNTVVVEKQEKVTASAQNDLQNCSRLSSVNTSDYFALHSIRPPFVRPNIIPPKDRYNENVSTFDPMLDEKRWTQNIPKLAGNSIQKSHLLRTPVQNSASLTVPVYHDICSVDSNSDTIRQPNTTSMCAQLMGGNKVRPIKPSDS